MAPRVRADLTAMSEESFDEILRVNLQGPFFLTQAVAAHWLSGAHGPALPGGFKIVFVTSISADTASITRGEYCISKAGLAMASQLWAVRLADRGRAGDRVASRHHGDRHDGGREGKVRRAAWPTGSCRSVDGARPKTWASAVRAVLAGHFPFTTGDVIHLDGGFHIRRL